MLLSSFSLLSLAILGHASSQSVLSPAANPHAQSTYAAPYGNGLFTPVGDLSTLSMDSFTTIEHPLFPNYSVRIKKMNLCDNQTSVHLSVSCSRLTFSLVPTQVTSTSKRDTCSSTSSRVAMILPRTTSFSGPMVVSPRYRCTPEAVE